LALVAVTGALLWYSSNGGLALVAVTMA